MKSRYATSLLLLAVFMSASSSHCLAMATGKDIVAMKSGWKSAQEDAFQVWNNSLLVNRDLKVNDVAGQLLSTCHCNKERLLHLQTIVWMHAVSHDKNMIESKTLIETAYNMISKTMTKSIQKDIDHLTKHVIPNSTNPALTNAASKLRDFLRKLQKGWLE